MQSIKRPQALDRAKKLVRLSRIDGRWWVVARNRGQQVYQACWESESEAAAARLDLIDDVASQIMVGAFA